MVITSAVRSVPEGAVRNCGPVWAVKEGETGVGEGRIGYACDVYMEVYFLRSTIFLGRFHTYGYYFAVPKGRRIDEFPTKLRKIIQMSARIAHIYAPSYRAVCASMSNENELVTSLAQNRTDDLGAPFAHLRRSALHP